MSGWLWWALGTFGIAGCVTIAIGFAVGWPVLIAFFSTRIGRFFGAIATGGVLLVAIYLKARSDGRAAEIARQKAKTETEIEDAAKERERIDALPDDAVDSELQRDWWRPE